MIVTRMTQKIAVTAEIWGDYTEQCLCGHGHAHAHASVRVHRRTQIFHIKTRQLQSPLVIFQNFER